MNATQTQPAAVLDTYGTMHVCSVAGQSIVVADHGSHYECMGSAHEPYRITTRLQRGRRVVDRCDCAAGKFGKPCRHAKAVQAVLNNW